MKIRVLGENFGIFSTHKVSSLKKKKKKKKKKIDVAPLHCLKAE